MEKMDIVAENVGKLKELFPEAFTEGKVDFDALKEVLGTFVDDRDERYSFTWNGKSKARMIAQTPSTGKDFVYKDNFKDNIKNYKEITGQVDGEGRNLSNNPETSGRYHTDWLNMMYPRLKLARNLLKDDGVIFISIDDNEVSNLRKMCDEVFGEQNLVANVIWEKKFSPQNDAKWLSDNHDHIVIYSRTKEIWRPCKLPRTDEVNSRFSNPDNDPRGPWASSDMTVKTYNANCDYPVVTPSGKTVNPTQGRCWAISKDKFDELVADNQVWFGKDGNNVPRFKSFLSNMDGLVPLTIWKYSEVGHNQEGRQEVKALFYDRGYFDGPKPVRLLSKIIHIANTTEDDIILDFFCGSATTAQAVMESNKENSKNQKFIMVQLPETCDKGTEAFKSGYKTIAEISKERIRRASAKIKEENPEYDGDLGFKVFKLDSTNIKPWEVDFDMTERTLEDFISNIKTDRREEDVLYEVLLKYGLDLTLPITEHTIAGQKVFDIGMGALIICLSDAISLEVVQGIAKLKDELNPEIMRVVFKDSGLKDDVVKTNAVQILKQAGIVDVRSL
ncbi:site-specific DNA-methyltransferase [uncultured Desulfobacter sp.]|uniref:site-specific DNA-methyltransferase n=1 Tax=uncultured Desulfobacter sp. TaxID=240139 RepID=UPI002AAB63BC|nr:site-specific DNA-methyltransferase [uncultured Desulfobacter sp.]